MHGVVAVPPLSPAQLRPNVTVCCGVQAQDAAAKGASPGAAPAAAPASPHRRSLSMPQRRSLMTRRRLSVPQSRGRGPAPGAQRERVRVINGT